MANSLTAASPTLWSKFAAYKLYKTTLFSQLASFKNESELKYGEKVDRPYRADLVAGNYTKGTAATAQDISFTQDLMTINNADEVFFYLDNIDKVQNIYDTARLNGEEAGKRLADRADARFLYEVKNANDTVDDGDLGGTSGNGLTAATNNIDDLFGSVAEVMDNNNVPANERCFVISPYLKRVLWHRLATKDSNLGDGVGKSFGFLGKYADFEVYQSNNLTCSARWTPANNPSNAATISIQGITLTFVSTIGTTAGNVLIGSTTADTLDNLVGLINAGGVTTDAGVSNVSLSAANRKAVQLWFAVDGTTYMDVYVKGANTLTLTTSEAADPWSRHKQHNVAMRKRSAVDMVMQMTPKMKVQEGTSNGLNGMYYLMTDLYGIETYNQGAKELVSVDIDESVI
jgi:hypothetical protein